MRQRKREGWQQHKGESMIKKQDELKELDLKAHRQQLIHPEAGQQAEKLKLMLTGNIQLPVAVEQLDLKSSDQTVKRVIEWLLQPLMISISI